MKMLSQETKKLAVFTALIAILTIACGFLLSTSRVEAIKLASISGLKEQALKMLSPTFISLIILTAALFALINHLCLKEKKNFVLKASLSGVIIGIVISLIAFGISAEKNFLSVFLIIGVFALIENAFIKKEELKKFIAFRTARSATQKAILLLALGLFLSTAFSILENKEKFIQEFEKEMINMALKQDNNQIADAIVEMIIQSNKQALALITQTPQYNALNSKNDAEVQAFITMMNSLQSQIDNPVMKETIKQKILSQQNASIISFDLVKEKIPFIKTIEKYYWLIASLGITSIFLFFANILIANLTGIFTALLLFFFKNQETN